MLDASHKIWNNSRVLRAWHRLQIFNTIIYSIAVYVMNIPSLWKRAINSFPNPLMFCNWLQYSVYADCCVDVALVKPLIILSALPCWVSGAAPRRSKASAINTRILALSAFSGLAKASKFLPAARAIRLRLARITSKLPARGALFGFSALDTGNTVFVVNHINIKRH